MRISIIPVLGVAVLVIGVAAAVLMIRLMPRRRNPSAEERAELAGAPMPFVQRNSWWALLIGVSALVAITVVLVTQGGAAAYWENDDLRMLVLMLFLAGLMGYVVVLLVPLAVREAREDLDERDLRILVRAPNVQPAAVLLALAAWLVSLTRMFRDEGAVPVVYLYLLFGSIILVLTISHALGILLGYRRVGYDGEG